MTHPLTDEICDKITDELSIFSIEDCMRSAADWQLEQVKKKVETKLSEWRKWSPNLYEEPCDHIEDFFYYIMQELRPQQQEDN